MCKYTDCSCMKASMSEPCLVVLLPSKDLSIAGLLTNTTEIKPGLKAFQISEDVWQQEVEQTPQLTQVVLQRRACNRLTKITLRRNKLENTFR